MATKAEKEQLGSWSEQVRIASTWVHGPKKRKLLKLADEIDPMVDTEPESEPVIPSDGDTPE